MHFFSKQKNRCFLAAGLSLFIVALLFLLLATPSNAYDVVIAWDANSEPDLAGYVLYVDDGTTQMPYEYVDDYPLENIDPENPRAKIADLQNDTAYYFVVTAYDTDGNESDYSNEICVMNGQKCPDSYLASRNDSSANGGSGGGGGGGCFISTSHNSQYNNSMPTNQNILLLLMFLAVPGSVYVFAFIKSTMT